MAEKIKVLQVVACMTYGGTEAFIMNHYRNIDKSRFQYDFWVFNESICDYREEIIDLNGGENNIYAGCQPALKDTFKFVNELTAFMQEKKYDVVHSHVNLANGLVMLAAKRTGIPVRISHAHDAKIGEKFTTRMLNSVRRMLVKHYANVFFACSQLAGEYVYGKEFYSQRGTMMPNGIEGDRFFDGEKKSNLRQQFRIPEEAYIIGNITRFEDKKNQLFLIRVFAELSKSDESNILVLGGPDGGQLQEAQDLVRCLGIEEKVRFIGMTKEIPSWLRTMELYVFPSKYEGLPIALLENQASGLYTIASDSITKELDLGLNLIQFLDLRVGEKEWARQILEYKQKISEKVELEEIREVLIAKGFDSMESVKKLERIYSSKGEEE